MLVPALAVPVPLIMLAPGLLVPVRPIMFLLVPLIMFLLVPLIMLAPGLLVPVRPIMFLLVPLIMLVAVPGIVFALWPLDVEGAGDGLPRGPTATAVAAPRATTPAANAPTSKGRLMAVLFCPPAPIEPIFLPYRAIIVYSFSDSPFLRGYPQTSYQVYRSWSGIM